MRRPERTGMPIGDRRVELLTKFTVKCPGVVARPHTQPAVGIGGNVPRRMPCRAGGQLIFLNKQTIADAGLGQMIENGCPDSTATDNNNTRLITHSQASSNRRP